MLELQAQLQDDGAHLDIDGITEQLVPLPLVPVVIGGAEVRLQPRAGPASRGAVFKKSFLGAYSR